MKKTYRKTKKVRKGKRSKTVRSKRRVGGVGSPVGLSINEIYKEPKRNMIDEEFSRKEYNKVFDNFKPGKGKLNISEIPTYDEYKNLPINDYTEYIDKNQNVKRTTPFFKGLYNRTFKRKPQRISLGDKKFFHPNENNRWNSETI